METFIHTIADTLSISSMIYCKKFDGANDYLIYGSGRNIYFYKFENNIPKYEFNYKVFGDVALIIACTCDNIPIILVILSSNNFCVIHYEKGEIVTDQKGEFPIILGIDIGQKYSYSLFNSILLIQLYQNDLHLFKIEKRKLVFLQYISFHTTAINRYQIISSNEFIVLHNNFGSSTFYDHYKFDLLATKLISRSVLPKIFNNFLYSKKNEFIISHNSFVYKKEESVENYMKLDLNEDIYDVFELNTDFYLAVTISGKIISIQKKEDFKSEIKNIGEIMKPLKPLKIDRNRFIFLSKCGEIKLFTMNGSHINLKTLFIFPGKVKKFFEISKRCILGLSPTNHLYRIERTLSLNNISEFQSGLKNRCWFFDESHILFSIGKNTKILNFHDQSENFDFLIQRDNETIGFHIFNDDYIIQITKHFVYINNEQLSATFSNISLPTFSQNLFAFCENSSQIVIASLDGSIVFHDHFPFQINSLALFDDKIIAFSSWESSSIQVYNLNFSENFSLDLIHEFDTLYIIDLLFMDDGELICALPPKNEVYFISLSDFSVKSVRCEGDHYKLLKISKDEILITGEKSFIINDKVITEVRNDKPFLYADFYNDLLLFSNTDNSLSIKKREKNYKFQVTWSSFPYRIIDISNYDNDLYAVIFENDQKEVKMELTKNVFNFDDYQNESQFQIESCKHACLITVKDAVSNSKYLVIAGSSEMLSLSYGNENHFTKKGHFQFDSKLTGLLNIEYNIFCLILVDAVITFSLEEGAFYQLSSIDTFGATACFSYLNKKLILGDMLGSFIMYNYQNNLFKEIYREGHELKTTSCAFINDDLLFGSDESSFLYQIKTTNENNYASKNLLIEKVTSIGSQAKTMIYCKDLNCILIGNANGEIIECKEINCDGFSCELYNKIENSLVSIGKFQSEYFRKCICGGYFVEIHRIYDADILELFWDLNDEQKNVIAKQNNFNLDEANHIITEIFDALLPIRYK